VFTKSLMVLVLAALVSPGSPLAAQTTESCSKNTATFLDTYELLYTHFLQERDVQQRVSRGGNARSDNLLDLLVGGVVQDLSNNAVEVTFKACPLTVEKILRGHGPLSNNRSVTDVITNALVLSNGDTRRMASDMTSPQFLRWLDRKYETWRRYPR